MVADSTPQPAALWAQAFKSWTDAWSALAGGAPGAAPADPFQLWRRSADQWLEAWTALMEQTFQNPQTVALSGRTLDSLLNVEKPLRERTTNAMAYWLEFWNMPSRTDLLRLAAQVNDANARLDELQVQLEDLSDRVEALNAGADGGRSAPAPAATRKEMTA